MFLTSSVSPRDLRSPGDVMIQTGANVGRLVAIVTAPWCPSIFMEGFAATGGAPAPGNGREAVTPCQVALTLGALRRAPSRSAVSSPLSNVFTPPIDLVNAGSKSL